MQRRLLGCPYGSGEVGEKKKKIGKKIGELKFAKKKIGKLGKNKKIG